MRTKYRLYVDIADEKNESKMRLELMKRIVDTKQRE